MIMNRISGLRFVRLSGVEGDKAADLRGSKIGFWADFLTPNKTSFHGF